MSANEPAASPASGRGMAKGAMLFLIPLLTLGFQICAKFVANITEASGEPWWSPAMLAGIAPWAAGIIICEVVAFLIWMRVLTHLPLSAAFPMTAVSYVLVVSAGWVLFHEPADARMLAGGAAILCGVYLIGREPGGRPDASE